MRRKEERNLHLAVYNSSNILRSELGDIDIDMMSSVLKDILK